MDKSLVFTPGCDWKIYRQPHILLVEYETVTGKLESKCFDLAAEIKYIVDGYKTLSFDEISKPESKSHYSIRRIVYFEKECNSMVAFTRGCEQNKLLIPTRIEFDTIIHVPKESPNVDSDRVKTIQSRIARDTLNSTYGLASRDWGDVLADSARYIYMSGARRSGKTMWLGNIAKSIEEDARNDALERWLKEPPIEPLPISPVAGKLYFQDKTTGEIKEFEGVKELKINGYFDTDMAMKYCLNDVAVTEKLFKEEKVMRFNSCKPTIEKVIFNEPATIVFWTDNTKTIVKCGENDIYDPEKGVAMCCMKKLLGTNKTGSNYLDNNETLRGVKRHIQKWEEDNRKEAKSMEESIEKEFEAVTGDDWKVSDNNE